MVIPSIVFLNWKQVLPRWHFFHPHPLKLWGKKAGISLALRQQCQRAFTHWIWDYTILFLMEFWESTTDCPGHCLFAEGYSKPHSYRLLIPNSIFFSAASTATPQTRLWSRASPRTVSLAKSWTEIVFWLQPLGSPHTLIKVTHGTARNGLIACQPSVPTRISLQLLTLTFLTCYFSLSGSLHLSRVFFLNYILLVTCWAVSPLIKFPATRPLFSQAMRHHQTLFCCLSSFEFLVCLFKDIITSILCTSVLLHICPANSKP